jgi:uncharacterized protein YdaT
MPCTLNDYPDSLKNLPHATKKKAIDIANAMIDEGYDEERAIPIATKQAKEWRKNASREKVAAYEKNGKPAQRSEKGKRYKNSPERLEEREYVIYQHNGWAVISAGAGRPSDVYDKKEDAVKRAREIARNKGTGLTVKKQDGTIQEEKSYRKQV